MTLCPKCEQPMAGTHKLVIWGDLRVLACPNMPLGEIAAVGPKPQDERKEGQ